MKSVVRILAAAAFAGVSSVYAEDADDVQDKAEPAAESSSAEAGGGAKPDARFFMTLPQAQMKLGTAEVKRLGSAEWTPVEDGNHYPLGSTFRTVGEASRLTVSFGNEACVLMKGDSSFQTRAQGLAEKSRSIVLSGGIIGVRLPGNLPEGMFTVAGPGFSVVNLAGNSSYRYESTGDGDVATVRCVTGTLAIDGRHFKIVSMKAADEVRIKSSQDNMFTGIYGTRGDYICRLDQGLVKITDIETGESRIEPKFLDWKISPQTAVRIHRAVPEIGKNMSVSVLTFDAAGVMKNRCAFTENRFEVNSGELAPTSKSGQAELVKKAAEATAEAEVETQVVADEETTDAASGDSSEE